MPAHDIVVTGVYERYFDVGHVANIVNYIMNGNAPSDKVALYDINNDGELNIGDVILIVKNILNNESTTPNAVKMDVSEMIELNQYTAAQFIVKVANNTNIKDIRLVNSMSQSHQLIYQRIDADKYAVVVFSLTNQLMCPENDNIIELETDNISKDALTIESVIVAKPTGDTDNYQTLPMSTGIQQIVKGNAPMVIYDLKGNRLDTRIKLGKGVFIINGKKTIK